jgi:hypothetical protein
MTDTGWKDAAADALDAQAGAIAAALDELANVEAVLEQRHRDKLAGELRGFAAGLRSEISDLQGQARALRARPRDNGAGFPLQLTAPATTRYPRGDHR